MIFNHCDSDGDEFIDRCEAHNCTVDLANLMFWHCLPFTYEPFSQCRWDCEGEDSEEAPADE